MEQKPVVMERERPVPASDAARRQGRLVCEQPCTVAVSLGAAVIEATLADLSCFGMMATTDTPVLPRAFVDVALPGGIRATGQVRWCRDGAFGIEFTAPLPARAVGPITRRHGARPLRLAVWSPVRMTADGVTRSVVLRDISDGGLQLAGTDNMPAGTRLTVELAHELSLDGTVRWSHDGRTGVELDETLTSEAREWVSFQLMSRA